MRMRSLFIAAALASVSIAASAQNTQTITVLHAIANNGDDPAGAKQIALKERLSSRCDGRDTCAARADEFVPESNFVIEVIYTCRDKDGSSRQIGPKQFGAGDNLELTCRD